MDQLLTIYKPVGKTPYQMVQIVKEKFPEYREEKIGYAGRLDPLAHGVLLLMVGEACKRRDQYQLLSKSYQFELLPGVSTDSYDSLGLIKSINFDNEIDKKTVKNSLNQFIGEFEQPYPPYSSFHLNGKPLYKLAKEGGLEKIKIPSKKVRITKIELTSERSIRFQVLLNEILIKISSVDGEFRQEQIVEAWNESVKLVSPDTEVKLFKIDLEATSGTYVRSIAHQLGNVLKTGAIAHDILRTQVGEFQLKDSIRLIENRS